MSIQAKGNELVCKTFYSVTGFSLLITGFDITWPTDLLQSICFPREAKAKRTKAESLFIACPINTFCTEAAPAFLSHRSLINELFPGYCIMVRPQLLWYKSMNSLFLIFFQQVGQFLCDKDSLVMGKCA